MALDSTGDRTQRRRSMIIVLIIIAGVTAVLLLRHFVNEATRPDPTPDRGAKSITLPASFDAFVTATGPAADQLRDRFRGGTTEPGEPAPHFELYRDQAGHLLLVLAVSAGDSVTARRYLQDQTPDDAVDSAMSDFSPIGSRELSPAPFTGAFRCATGLVAQNEAGGTPSAVCVWADHDTSVTVLDLSSTAGTKGVTTAELGATTRRLRVLAEPA